MLPEACSLHHPARNLYQAQSFLFVHHSGYACRHILSRCYAPTLPQVVSPTASTSVPAHTPPQKVPVALSPSLLSSFPPMPLQLSHWIQDLSQIQCPSQALIYRYTHPPLPGTPFPPGRSPAPSQHAVPLAPEIQKPHHALFRRLLPRSHLAPTSAAARPLPHSSYIPPPDGG